MPTYSNPRLEAVIENWPSGGKRVVAHFKIEVKGSKERGTRFTVDPKTGKPLKKPPYEPGCCPKCGSPPNPLGSMDSHIPSDMDRQEILHDMMRASEQAKAMRGTTPDAIEGILKELNNPELRARDIIRDARMRWKRDVGRQNDWKRFRRRGLAMTPAFYHPKKKEHTSEWVAMIDT